MLNTILITIGVLLILYSVYIIKKDLLNDKLKEEQLSSIKENKDKYYEDKDETPNFNHLISRKSYNVDIDYDIYKPNADKSYEMYKKDKTDKTYNIEDKENKNLEFRREIVGSKDLNIKDKDYMSKNDRPSLSKEHKKIIELFNIGLTEEEIAKKLQKGIREVEITIKMYKS